MHRNNFEPKLLSFIHGDLPHKNSNEAYSKIKKFSPLTPSWPRLPKRSYKEEAVSQFIENLVALRLDDEEQKAIYENMDNKEDKIALFYDKVLKQDFEHFKISKEYAEGLYLLLEDLEAGKLKEAEFIKGQVVGPFTLANSINNRENKSLIFDEVMFDIIVNGLAMKGLWQAEQFKKFKKKPIIFFEEPVFCQLEKSQKVSLSQDVSKRFLELLNPLKQADVLVGLHCCQYSDWPIFLKSMVDIISFDAWNHFDKLAAFADELKAFVESGGVLAFGIVPAKEIPADFSVNVVLGKIKQQFDMLAKAGIDKKNLLKKTLITNTCGLSSLSEEKAEKVLEVLQDTSSSLRREYFK